MRPTEIVWFCSKGTRNPNSARICPCCDQNHFERYAQPHASDRAVVYVHPVTGERRIPARNDMPMPVQYAQAGFERQEIMSITAFERQTGLVHEDTNYNAGNEIAATGLPPLPERPKLKPEVQKDIKDFVEAQLADGPLTLDGVKI